MKKNIPMIIGIILLSALVGGSYFVAMSQLEAAIRKDIEESNALNPDFQVIYGEINVNPISQTATMPNVTVSFGPQAKVTMERVDILDFIDDPDHKRINCTIHGIIPQANPMAAGLTAMLGYEAPIKADATINFDVENGLLEIEEMSYGAKDVGRIEFSASGAGVNMSLLDSKTPEEQARLWEGLIMHKVSLTYEDDSLLERAVHLQATQEKCSEQEILTKVKAQVQNMAARKNNPATQQLQQAVLAFLDDPGSLTLSITLNKDISMEQLKQHLPQLDQYVELEATAKGKSQLN